MGQLVCRTTCVDGESQASGHICQAQSRILHVFGIAPSPSRNFDKIIIMNGQGEYKYVWAKPDVGMISGVTPENLIGRNIADVLPSELCYHVKHHIHETLCNQKSLDAIYQVLLDTGVHRIRIAFTPLEANIVRLGINQTRMMDHEEDCSIPHEGLCSHQ